MTEERHITVYLIADDQHIVGSTDICHTSQCLGIPRQTCGIMGIGEDEQSVARVTRQRFQPLEIHSIARQPALIVMLFYERIHHDLASIVLRHEAEGMIDGGLDDDALVLADKRMDNHADTFHDTWNESQPVALHLPAVAVAQPTLNAAPQFFGHHGVAQDGMFQPAPQGVDDERWCGELHICHPQRQQVVTSEELLQFAMFHVATACAVDDAVEVVCHVISGECRV